MAFAISLVPPLSVIGLTLESGALRRALTAQFGKDLAQHVGFGDPRAQADLHRPGAQVALLPRWCGPP
ncbi:hypothetical protein [Saccharopolyspora sp. NPDC049426]|uniref:hypothetical protein n=1 Tax=Saccharopolyspora sp. NPDC049426 TaxID=3155652 RepID=UPI003420C667